jgi:protein-tyrosine-phosphatase
MNSVRSVMAEALARYHFGRSLYVQSAGIRKGTVDGFTARVLADIGLDVSKHKPRTLEELIDWEGINFDHMITLAPEAHHRGLEMTRSVDIEVEYWPTPDPSLEEGSQSQRLQAYATVRDYLEQKIKTRFKELTF